MYTSWMHWVNNLQLKNILMETLNMNFHLSSSIEARMKILCFWSKKIQIINPHFINTSIFFVPGTEK